MSTASLSKRLDNLTSAERRPVLVWWKEDETAEEATARHLALHPEHADVKLTLISWMRT